MTNLEKIQSNATIKFLHGILGTIHYSYEDLHLTGGAVIDILEGRVPKDYDFIGKRDRTISDSTIEKFKKNGFKFQYETSTSITYYGHGITIQFLKTKISEFDFTISQSIYSFKDKTLSIDETSFYNKTLIPVSFTNKKQVFNCLKRIPHWKKKGYEINDLTYLSLLGASPLNTSDNGLLES